MKKLAIFGSGSGSNAENIYHYFKDSLIIKIVFICTDHKDAYIAKRAKKFNLPIIYTSKSELNDFYNFKKKITTYNLDYIILAGFLLKIPSVMVSYYSNRIINIHPSLLPKYGGKGMYGRNVHRAIIENNEKESGITIHFVNKNYDEGKIILQKRCVVSVKETVDSLEKKIQSLEFKYLPKTIEKIALK